MSLLRKKLKIMATKTFEELKQLAIQIRDEKTNKQNTATRIGTQMLEHLDKLEQDYYDKTATDEELQARDEKLTELENKKDIFGIANVNNTINTFYDNQGWIDSQGNVTEFETWVHTSKIEIPEDAKVVYYEAIGFSSYAILFYNGNNVIKGIPFGDGSKTKKYFVCSVPDNATHIVVSKYDGDSKLLYSTSYNMLNVLEFYNQYHTYINNTNSTFNEVNKNISLNRNDLNKIFNHILKNDFINRGFVTKNGIIQDEISDSANYRTDYIECSNIKYIRLNYPSNSTEQVLEVAFFDEKKNIILEGSGIHGDWITVPTDAKFVILTVGNDEINFDNICDIVYDYIYIINQVKEELSSVKLNSSQFSIKGWVGKDGAIHPESSETSNKRTDYIDVTNYSKVKLNVPSNLTSMVLEVAFFNEDKEPLIDVSGEHGELINIPYTAKYMICTIGNIYKDYGDVGFLVPSIDKFTNKIYTSVDSSAFTVDSKYIAKNWSGSITEGTLLGDSHFKSTNKIPVSKTDKVTITFDGYSKYSYCLGFYDYNDNFILGYDKAGTYNVPENASYIRSSWRFDLEDGGIDATLVNVYILSNVVERIEKSIDEIKSDISTINDKINNGSLNITDKKVIYDVNIMFTMGQSLSLGAGIGEIDQTGNYYDTRELEGNSTLYIIKDNSDLINSNNFIDSSSATYIKDKVVEMPARGMTIEYLKLCKEEGLINGTSCIILNNGYGGITLQEIIDNFGNTKKTLQSFVNKIHNEGKTVGIPVVGWIQGEADNRVFDYGEKYYNDLNSFFDELSDFIVSITDQVNPPQFLLYQTNGYERFLIDDKRLNIALKQLELAENRNDTYLVSPMYPFKFNVDSTHVQLFGSRNAGANMGVYAKMLTVDNNLKIDFLHVIKHSVFKAGEKWIIYLQCSVPVAPLVIDKKDIQNPLSDKVYTKLTESYTQEETSVDNAGFELFSTGWTQEIDDNVINPTTATQSWTAPKLTNWNKQDIIENVEIVRETSIKITCTSDPTGLELWYARRGCQGGGFIHDSQSNKIIIKGTEYPVYNWMPVFMISL